MGLPRFLKQYLVLLLFLPTIAFAQTIGTQTNTDNFNRADEAPLSGGGNWSSTTNRIDLVSNQVQPAGTSNDREAIYTAWSNGDDQYSQIKVTAITGTAGNGFGPCVRHNSTVGTKTMYRLILNGDGEYELLKFITGTPTSLASGTVTYSAGTALGLSINGTTLKMWYGGTQFGSNITDSGIASGVPGIAYSSSLSSVPTGDDWDAGTTSGAVSNPTNRHFFMLFGWIYRNLIIYHPPR